MADCDRLQRELYVLEQQLDVRRREGINENQFNNLMRGITIKRDQVARACNQNFNQDNGLGEALEFKFRARKKRSPKKRKSKVRSPKKRKSKVRSPKKRKSKRRSLKSRR